MLCPLNFVALISIVLELKLSLKGKYMSTYADRNDPTMMRVVNINLQKCIKMQMWSLTFSLLTILLFNLSSNGSFLQLSFKQIASLSHNFDSLSYDSMSEFAN